ncbi:MAG: START domain-containing protein [Chitinophagales bacterium]|nr:START domain-containing protein [Chitinophagales bacterium]
MKAVRIFAIGCIIFISVSFTIDKNPEWVLQKQESGILVYTRLSAGSNLKEVKVTNKVKSSLSGIVALLLDTKNYPNWIYACSEARTLKVINDHELYSYQVTHLPWPFNDRDVISYFNISQDSDNKTVRFNRTGIPDYLPPVDGKVRLPQFRSDYTLKPLTADSVLVELELHLDPGGSLPAWLLNANLVTAPYKSTVEMMKQLPRYQNASYSFIKENNQQY